MYSEDDLLLISGIQHYEVCPRQWALIHIEQQWTENLLTVEGKIMHENTHDEFFTEKRKDLIITRGMRVESKKLGVTGVCDVVEFHASENGVPLTGRMGKWVPVPVEYKRGKPKEHDADRLQLCGQALCLEEMLVCDIPIGYLFYGEIKRREKVEFSEELRNKTMECFREMNRLYSRGHTPKVKAKPFCRACSLVNICLPKMNKVPSVRKYIADNLEDSDQ